MSRLIKNSIPAAALVLVLGFAAQTASAQNFGFSFGHRGRHNAVGFGFSTGPAYAPVRAYVPGHYETVYEQVWVEGCTRRVWVDACFTTRYDDRGCAVRVCSAPGHWTFVQDAGHYETRAVQVWVSGCYR